VLLAKAHYEVLNEKIEAIKARLLADTVYLDEHDGKRITETRFDWTMGDKAFATYAADLAAGTLALGYEMPDGKCPALMAKADLVKAEDLLIEAARTTLPNCEHMTAHRVICGTKDKNGLEFRREWLDTLIGAAVNAPGYKAPLAA